MTTPTAYPPPPPPSHPPHLLVLTAASWIPDDSGLFATKSPRRIVPSDRLVAALFGALDNSSDDFAAKLAPAIVAHFADCFKRRPLMQQSALVQAALLQAAVSPRASGRPTTRAGAGAGVGSSVDTGSTARGTGGDLVDDNPVERTAASLSNPKNLKQLVQELLVSHRTRFGCPLW